MLWKESCESCESWEQDNNDKAIGKCEDLSILIVEKKDGKIRLAGTDNIYVCTTIHFHCLRYKRKELE